MASIEFNAEIVDSLRKENEALRKDNTNLSAQVDELSTQLADLTDLLSRQESNSKNETNSTNIPVESKYDHNWVIPGNEHYCNKVVSTIEDVHNKQNILCIQLNPTHSCIIASGGVDKTVRITNWKSSAQVIDNNLMMKCKAPPLTLDWRPVHNDGLLAIGCMDGSLYLASVEYDIFSIDTTSTTVAPAAVENNSSSKNDTICLKSIQSLCCISPHTRYITSFKWSQDGNFLGSCSVDKVIKLWAVCETTHVNDIHIEVEENDDNVEEEAVNDNIDAKGKNELMKCVQSWYREECIEALCFMNNHLIFAERNHHSLLYVDLSTNALTMSEVSLNNNDFDQHVSFTILNLVPSPDSKHLLASTDKNKHIIYPMKSNQHVRTLYGHSSDEFAKPRACWDISGKVLFLSSTLCCI